MITGQNYGESDADPKFCTVVAVARTWGRFCRPSTLPVQRREVTKFLPASGSRSPVPPGFSAVVSVLTGTENEAPACMSLTFVVVACVFVALVGALVACVDRWRDSRLALTRPLQRVGVRVGRIPTVPDSRKRAA